MGVVTFPADRRVLFVHAHPDDETINNGATMARYVAEGAHVTLVTCTRGEEGEVIPADLAHLASHASDTLGDHRVEELAAAMRALGVTDHRFLDECGIGGPRAVRYRDSGMAWGPDGQAVPAPDTKDGAFARVDLDEPASRLADVILELEPQVVVTYEPGGGYGHPDHVQAHRVTMRAVELAAGSPDGWRVPKVYWTVVPAGLMRAFLAQVEASGGDNPFQGWRADGPLPSMFVPDDVVTTHIDATAYVTRKADAMRAHATQIAVDGPLFALSNGVDQPLVGTEFYQLALGEPGSDTDADGRERDLFAGV